MKLYKTALSIIFLLILLSVLYFQKRKYQSEISNMISVERLEEAQSIFEKKLKNDNFREFLQFSNSNLEIDRKSVLKHQSSFLTFSDLLETEYKLFFNFSDINCTTCINQEVKNIKLFSDSVGVDRIVLLANYRNERALTIFKRMNGLKNKIYNLDSSTLGLPIENYNLPFYFIANESGIAKHVFVPEKERADLSRKYYQSMISKMD
ncbi:hypothetical protein [Gracilimonas sp.]|uniref:hypothetical protein n=1 Tax=Gracilimonas sp. TaxID=1974203 RepID=UPI0028717AD2|nr:hypothetical protein [Gracilimonas sp.]